MDSSLCRTLSQSDVFQSYLLLFISIAGYDKELPRLNEGCSGHRLSEHGNAVKFTFLFVLTDCIIWNYYFLNIYNDKNGNWLYTQYRKLDFEEFCAAAISVNQLKEWRAWNKCRAWLWAVCEGWQQIDYVRRNLPLCPLGSNCPASLSLFSFFLYSMGHAGRKVSPSTTPPLFKYENLTLFSSLLSCSCPPFLSMYSLHCIPPFLNNSFMSIRVLSIYKILNPMNVTASHLWWDTLAYKSHYSPFSLPCSRVCGLC